MNQKILWKCLLVIVLIAAIFYEVFVVKHDPDMAYFKRDFFVLPYVSNGVMVYRLTNVGDSSIIIDIADYNGTAQAGYASRIDPKHYSEFVHQGKKLLFACYDNEKESSRTKCSGVIKLTMAPTVAIPSNAGNYWRIENKLES